MTDTPDVPSEGDPFGLKHVAKSADYVIGLAAILISGAAVAGLAFGYGYGVVGPTAIVWGSAPYPRDEASRARPVALVTTCFNLGSIVIAQLTGAALPAFGWSGLLLALAALLMLILLACATAQLRPLT
jgi:MFS family permease